VHLCFVLFINCVDVSASDELKGSVYLCFVQFIERAVCQAIMKMFAELDIPRQFSKSISHGASSHSSFDSLYTS
jgi:hypothetical protein